MRIRDTFIVNNLTKKLNIFYFHKIVEIVSRTTHQKLRFCFISLRLSLIMCWQIQVLNQ